MKSLCVTCGLMMAGLLAADAHEWTDRSDKFHVEASFVAVKDGKVYLEKEGGKIISVPLEKLSEKSLDYLQSLPETKPYFNEHPWKPADPGSSPKTAEVHADAP